MGMFDSFYDTDNSEWQTKAYHCVLAEYKIGDSITGDFPDSYPATYQVEVLGGTDDDPYQDSLATIRDGVVASINDPRDPSLPLLDYSGHLIAEGV